jgi:hypothetical protein
MLTAHVVLVSDGDPPAVGRVLSASFGLSLLIALAARYGARVERRARQQRFDRRSQRQHQQHLERQRLVPERAGRVNAGPVASRRFPAPAVMPGRPPAVSRGPGYTEWAGQVVEVLAAAGPAGLLRPDITDRLAMMGSPPDRDVLDGVLRDLVEDLRVTVNPDGSRYYVRWAGV